MKRWIITVKVILGPTLLFVGLFLLYRGAWNYLFGTRIGIMLSPLILLFGGSLISAGIIIVSRLVALSLRKRRSRHKQPTSLE